MTFWVSKVAFPFHSHYNCRNLSKGWADLNQHTELWNQSFWWSHHCLTHMTHSGASQACRMLETAQYQGCRTNWPVATVLDFSPLDHLMLSTTTQTLTSPGACPICLPPSGVRGCTLSYSFGWNPISWSFCRENPTRASWSNFLPFPKRSWN